VYTLGWTYTEQVTVYTLGWTYTEQVTVYKVESIIHNIILMFTT